MVASTRSSSKRYLQYANEEDVMPRKRARKSILTTPFPLLDLPPEVRALVLEELLLLSEPVEFTSGKMQYGTVAQWRAHFAALPPPRLFPAILCTCKQLYEEGSKILYSNTIMCRISNTRDKLLWCGNPLVILARRWGEVGELPRAILNKISKIHIDIYLHYKDPYYNLLQVEDAVRELAKGVRTKASSWNDFSIELIHVEPIEERTTDFFESPDEVLKPLIYLRKCSKVLIKGASEAFASELTNLMTSTTPCVDLDLMLDAAEKYVLDKFPEEDDDEPSEDDESDDRAIQKIWDIYSLLEPARDKNDAEAFFKARSQLLLLVSLYERRKLADVFEHDPPDRKADDWLRTKEPTMGIEEAEETMEAVGRMMPARD